MLRRTLISAALAAATVGYGMHVGAATPAVSPVTVQQSLGPGGFASPNVSYVASIPTGGGVSAKEVTVGKQRRLYVSSAHGLQIYDITNPALPLPLGELPIYNWENEAIAVSDDGRTTILTEFEELLYLHVIDTSNPAVPVRKGSIILKGAHTVACADRPCNYLFGSDGVTYDIRDRANPKALPAAQGWAQKIGSRPGHALHKDAAGYWVSDTTPIVVFRADNPLAPKRVATGSFRFKTAYQHNNVRPAARRYKPRAVTDKSAALRPGELLMTEGETNFTGQCDGTNGAFSTWSMVGFEKGKPLRQLHVFRPVNGDYADGNPAVNAMGCSGHWFTVREDMPGRFRGEYLVAAAWYEHGTRVLAVNAATGKIREVGFFQPGVGAASSAYWISGTDYIYTIDYQRGIDILRFDPKGVLPSPSLARQSWLAKVGVVDPLADADRWFCRKGVSGRRAG